MHIRTRVTLNLFVESTCLYGSATRVCVPRFSKMKTIQETQRKIILQLVQQRFYLSKKISDKGHVIFTYRPSSDYGREYLFN